MAEKINLKEKGFEAHIESYLHEKNGFVIRENTKYNNETCLDEDVFFDFLADTQPEAVEKLKKNHSELYRQRIIKRINDQIKSKGIIEVLRKGIEDLGVRLRLFYDKPVSSLNQQSQKNYEANVFSIMRQVYYSQRNKNSLDMMIFINGLPVISFELKNELTKQTVKDAIWQYKNDRDQNEEIFRLGRLLVNFAVDTDQVYMCTQLKGTSSFFMPFNKGYNMGAGNPPSDRIKTSYLWEEILSKDSLTNIIKNYAQLITEEKEHTNNKGEIKTKKEKKLIFPRYHQLMAVRKLLEDAKSKGTGQKYLIQHSAGSGKSNSIAWLAHQLVGLHDEAGRDNIFDSVIVVTDRRVLDAQIRGTIKQFTQEKATVQAVTEGSKQLKEALEEGKKIIITTIQKFPYIVEEIGELTASKFAIIIDEAHSSLSGQMARKLNETLAKHHIDSEEEFNNDDDNTEATGEDMIRVIIKARKLLPNASYFAFTATPKNKTLELFGESFQDEGQIKYRAFHLYSMKQAIQEGFILDVLQNYTTYKSYYALLKKIEDDPEYDKKKAEKKLRAFVNTKDYVIEKKTEMMIDHFLDSVIKKKKIGGKAKAMVVTSSRKNAVAYKHAFDKYLASIHRPYKAIVAFSGEIKGQTESNLNGFSSDSIRTEFKKDEYKFLIVANKFQTGFDEPLLHTMYVDKILGGVNAVQTLSRLNRSHPQKQETFVLDLVNTTEDIEKAFSPFYKTTTLGEGTDPNKLFDLKDALDNFQVYSLEQIESVVKLILEKVPKNQKNKNLDAIHAVLDLSAKVFNEDLPEEEQEDFKAKCKTYVRLYVFLSQIVPFENPYLEKLYMFLNMLQNKLETKDTGGFIDILNNIDMDSYRLHLESDGSIALDENAEPLKPIPTDMRSGKAEEEIDALSSIIQGFNDRFGTEFEDVDKVRKISEDIMDDVEKDEEFLKSLKNSDKQNAKITFDTKLSEKMLTHLNTNFDFYKAFTDNKDFQKEFSKNIFELILKRI